MKETIEESLTIIETDRHRRGEYHAQRRLTALGDLIEAIRSAPETEQESLAAHAKDRLKPIAHELLDLWEPAADMIGSVIERDDEPAIDPLTVLADFAPSILWVESAMRSLAQAFKAEREQRALSLH